MRSEELFLLINEIDDRLIDDAENEVRPEKITVKGGMSFKEIAAFAACFAVLAAGIFAVVKFKTSGVTPAPGDSTISPVVSDESNSSDNSSDFSDNSNDSSDNSTVSKPVKEPDMVKDTAFSHIIQPYLEKGSLADTLRGIMLRAKTVEELETAIHAADTENKVTEIKVTKKPDNGEYSKGGIPVTSGYIDERMTISVTYDDGSENRTGVQYIVGSCFDEYYGQIISEGDFEILLENAIRKAETVAQLRQLIYEVDIHDRVTGIRVYTDSGLTNEVTDGDLKNGMIVYITYDNEAYLRGAVYGQITGVDMGLFNSFRSLNIDTSYIGLKMIADPNFSFIDDPIGMGAFAELAGDENSGIHFGFIEGHEETVFMVGPSTRNDGNVHPIANNFEDFLKLIVTCKNVKPLTRVHEMTSEEFYDALEKQQLDLENTEAVLSVIRSELGIKQMDDPYRYVEFVQKGFNS